MYLDDVGVFSGTFQVNLQRLTTVLEAIWVTGLSLKPEKCRFGYHELKFLEHVISAVGVRPDPEKTPAITNFPRLKDKKQVRSFLGI